MANLGEYDEPSPCPTAYSRRLTASQHEAVVSSETEKQLNLLLTHLEDNPKQFSELLKKRKIKEMERGGLLSNIKVKVLTALYGEDFVDDVDPQTCQEKLKEFEALSVKVYNYSQEAKGNSHKFARRCSKRIAERNRSRGVAAPPPPPPPPPIVKKQEIRKCNADPNVDFPKDKSSTSRHFSEDDCIVVSPSSSKNIQEEIRRLSKTIVKRKPLKDVSINQERGTQSSECSFHSELMNARMGLRPICPKNKTPYQQSRQRREAENEQEQDENRFPLFNQALIQKFRNTRSPESPSENFDGELSGRNFELTP